MELTFSVIIPALNEASQIRDCIQSCRNAGPCEVIVVDGGSSDETVVLAAAADQILAAVRGRSTQQNAGADIASGDVLVFLHADCRLPAESFLAIQHALHASPLVVAGCFQQRIEHANWKYRITEWGDAWRVRLLGWMYGDQGIFVRRQTFVVIGGFPDLALMEDIALSKRLWRQGKCMLLPQRLIVSPRRWEKIGMLRQAFLNWMFVILWHLGVSANTLARWYAAVR